MTEIELYHPYDLWYEPSWLVRYYSIIGAGLLIALLMGIVTFFYRRRKLRQKPCWYHALSQVEALKKVANLENHIFYARLIFIIKSYLTQRYSTDFLSKTEEEIINYVQHYSLSNVPTADIEKIFKAAIVIKFAHQSVTKAQLDEDIAISIRIIKKSIPNENKRDAY